MAPSDKKIAKNKIAQLVFLHGTWVHYLTNIQINTVAEKERLYNEWIVGYITLDEIQKDIEEYKQMISTINSN